MNVAVPDHLLRVPARESFAVAKEVGCAGVELTISAYTVESHPLLNTDGATALASAARASGVAIASVSASFITHWGLIDSQAQVRQRSVSLIERLLDACQGAAVPVLHLPCQGASEPRSKGDQQLLLEVLRPLVRRAGEVGVTLALDPLESGDTCRDWLTTLNSAAAKAAYDVGNARAAGRDCVAEIQLLGDTLAQVRLRDRARREPFASVPFGEGGVNFGEVVQALERRAFTGWLILEGPSGDEPRAAVRKNLDYVRGAQERTASVAMDSGSSLEIPVTI